MKLVGHKTALYLRRSTEEHQEASLEVQRSEGTAYIEREGGTLDPGHIFVDDSKSRAEFKKRPGLIAMLNAADARAFDAVVVRDETRLGGDTFRAGLAIQDLIESGVRLLYYFSDEEITIDGAVDKFLVAARSFASELEREKISQRTHEHLMTKARRGFVVGGRVYGYDNVEVREGDRRVRVEYRINVEQATIIIEIFRRYAAGEGLRTLAKDLNARRIPPPRAGKRGTGSWSPAALWAILRRERYRGLLVWGRREKAYRKGTKVRLARDPSEWIRVDAPDLRIIEDALWNAVQAQIRPVAPDDGRHRRAGGPKMRHLLSGIARCAECGGPLTVTSGKQSYTPIKVYTCGWHRTRGETVCRNTSRRPVETVDAAVLGWVKEHVLTEELMLDVLREVRRRLAQRAATTTSDVPRLESEAAGLRAEVDRLVAAIATTAQAPAPLVRALAERQERLDALDARLRAAKAAPNAIEVEVRRMEAEAKQRIADVRAALGRNPEAARKVLDVILDGPLRVSPVDLPEGRRFQIEGAAAVGRLLAMDCENPNSASPAGFEPA